AQPRALDAAKVRVTVQPPGPADVAYHRTTWAIVSLKACGRRLRRFVLRQGTVKADMTSRTDHEIFDLGDFTLSGGATLRGARLAYKTYGTLSENRDNAIVYPTWYSGRHWENEWLIGGEIGRASCREGGQ